MRRGALVLIALTVAAAAAEAQQARLRSTTTVSYIQLRPFTLDSAGNYVSGSVAAAVPVIEDLEASAWGLGLPGLRAYGLVRLRAAAGSGLVWPRSSDHFDALAAYLELERPAYRIRLGRQQRASGFGLYGFDGGLGTWRPLPNVRFEAWGGRALARGFNDPITNGAIRDLDPLIPDRGTLLLGASAWAAPTAQSMVTATWQKEVLNDFSGVVSERAGLDAQTTLAGRWTLSGSADYDLAASALGRARLTAQARLPLGGSMRFSLFRYRPVFDLNTIWGVFAPQGNHGASAAIQLAPSAGLTLHADWTLRRYEKVTETTPFLVNVGTTSNTLSLGAGVTRGALAFDGAWHYATGYGGAESSGDLRAGWNDGRRWQVGLNASAFQTTEYFRVARGTVFGFGGDASLRASERLAVSARLTQYVHGGTTGMASPDWSQLRGSLRVDWIFGANADRMPVYR